jgi:hypothetical protein
MVSPQLVYDNLSLLERSDIVHSAHYRVLAQEVLADPTISLSWRQAIADKLNQVNLLLGMQTVGPNDDSY